MALLPVCSCLPAIIARIFPKSMPIFLLCRGLFLKKTPYPSPLPPLRDNASCATGNDVYGFSVFDGEITTIWDAGGYDVIDMSGVTVLAPISTGQPGIAMEAWGYP